MALQSGFFNSIDGDRKYNADDFSDYFEGILTDGIYHSVGERFQCVFRSDDFSVTVGTGRAKILNKYIRNTTAYSITLDPPDASKDRMDTICLKMDKSSSGERAGSIVVLKGELSSSPKAPSIPAATEDVKYYPIHTFRINHGAISPQSVRTYVGTSQCPYVTVDKSIDMDSLYQSFETAYNTIIADMQQFEQDAEKEFAAWFASVSEQVSGWSVKTISDEYPYAFELEHLTECRFENPDSSESTTVTIKIPSAPPSNYHSRAVLKGFQYVTINFASVLKPPTNLSGSSGVKIITTDTDTIKFVRHEFQNAYTIKVFDLYYDGFGYRYTWSEIQEEA